MRDERKEEQPGEGGRGAAIKVPPPGIYGVLFLVGLWAETALYRLRFGGDDGAPAGILAVGTVLFVVGLALSAWGLLTFLRIRTAILPFRPSTTLVTHGPYRFSRNPIYFGVNLTYAGGSLMLNAMWPLLLLPLAIVLMHFLVIRPEEEHLAERFGDAYQAYRSRVRRWL